MALAFSKNLLRHLRKDREAGLDSKPSHALNLGSRDALLTNLVFSTGVSVEFGWLLNYPGERFAGQKVGKQG